MLVWCGMVYNWAFLCVSTTNEDLCVCFFLNKMKLLCEKPWTRFSFVCTISVANNLARIWIFAGKLWRKVVWCSHVSAIYSWWSILCIYYICAGMPLILCAQVQVPIHQRFIRTWTYFVTFCLVSKCCS